MDQYKTMTQSSQNSAPTTTRTISLKTAKFITTAFLGTTMLLISGLTLTGVVLGLTVTTPFFVIFSPVLILALIATLMVITGILFSGSCGIVALVGFKRLYNCTRGRSTIRADQTHCVDAEIREKARELKDFVKEYVKVGQNRADHDIKSRA